MPKRILVIQGHPDPEGQHFCHALAEAYAAGAAQAGHPLRRIEVATLDFPLLRDKATFENGPLPASLAGSQEALAWAEHVVLVYPLWLGTMPALLKGYLEQVLRPDFAFDYRGRAAGTPRLKGRSARIVVTMGMPGWIYRWYFGAHGLRNLERNILRFCGIAPVRHSLVGSVERRDGSARSRWLARIRELGLRAG